MTTSFFNGISGLKTFQSGIDIWGDNIANINTPAFKESIPEFSTIFAKNLASSPISSDIGLGSMLDASAKNMQMGSLINTDKTFDLALDKEGWFEVKKGKENFYTRDGRFSRDADGYLVNDEGAYLIGANANNLIKTQNGYVVNTSINTDNLIKTGTFSPIFLPNNVILPAVPTTEINIKANLNNNDHLTNPSPAEGDLYFSALYDKDGNFLNMVDGNSIAYTLGDNITYDNGLFQKEICIADDVKDGKDVNFDFSVNGKEIKLTLPDGSTKEEITNALANVLKKNGILYQINNNGIVIESKDALIINSNDNYVKNAAGFLFVYKNNPTTPNQFNTLDSLASKMQDALNLIYPNDAKVSVENGKIVVDNVSDDTIESKFIKTQDSNESFFKNIYSAGNVILPHTAAKSYQFNSNEQSFGGYIYEANGNKDDISFRFLKKEVTGDNTIWRGEISISNNGNIISQNNFDFTFNNEGFLISPKNITLNSPQKITIKTNLSAFRGIDNKISYSFNQNGIKEGFLKDYEINQLGDIFANFSNDKSIKLATIPIYHFVNDQGLESVGGSLFKETSNSNKAFLYEDANGNYLPGSNIHSHMLETSNVQMTQAMTELIINQKAFSAAAKTVTTSDQMIQRAINMKRG